MLIMLAVICLLLVCGYTIIQQQNRTWKCLAHLPSYPQLPLIGSAHYFLGDGQQILHRLMEMTDISEKSQLPFVVWLRAHPNILLTDFEDIKSVTNEFIEKPYHYNFFRPWLGDGLFSAPVDIWKRNIKKLGRIFTSSVVDGFQDIFNSQAQKLIQSLKTEVGQAPFDAKEKYLSKAALNTAWQITFGVSEISDKETNKYCTALKKIVDIIHMRIFNVLLHSNFLFGLTSYKKEMMKAIDKLHRVSETKCFSHTEDIRSNFKSYMDVLFELKENDPTLTFKWVKNEIDTLILAAQESVTTSLYYVMLMIGCHPKVQDKLYAEIKEIFSNDKRELTKEDLNRMTYCEAVINETLRLYPAIPVVFRGADHDLQLKTCAVPKGTSCIINIFGVGRSKKYWGSDAMDFRPERFEPKSTPAALIAFSTGKRACTGKKYTMAIMKTFLAYCLRELVFISEADKIQLKTDFMLRMVDGNLLQVQLRQN